MQETKSIRYARRETHPYKYKKIGYSQMKGSKKLVITVDHRLTTDSWVHSVFLLEKNVNCN